MSKGNLTLANKGNLILCACLLLWAVSCVARADGSPLIDQAEAYLRQQIQRQLQPEDNIQPLIELRQPNPRLKLDNCATAISFSSSRPISAGSVTLKASCDYPRRWQHYLQGKIKLMRRVLISRHPLSKGHQLETGDLRLTLHDQRQLRDGFFIDPKQVIGHQLNRSLASNKPITPKLLSPPILIHQGDIITIQAGRGSISVEMTGIALEQGRKGQQIKVENSRSSRIIKATVIERGKVKIIR